MEQLETSQVPQVHWDGFGWGGTPKTRDIQEDEKGTDPTIPPGDIFPSRWTWSTPTSRATRASGSTVSGERRGHWDGDFGVIPWGKGVWNGMVAFLSRPGSVVVDHTVIVSLLVTSQSEEKLQNITANVQEKIEVAATQLNCTYGNLSPSHRWGGDNQGHPWGGDTFPATQTAPRQPWEGLSPLNLTSLTGDLCFNSSDVKVTNTSLEFDKDGERTGGIHVGLGSPGVPPG